MDEQIWYECDECEDRETNDRIINDGWACECGGSMYLLRVDNYCEHENKCFKCKNYASIWCMTCKYSKER